jgi:hypothetical protein
MRTALAFRKGSNLHLRHSLVTPHKQMRHRTKGARDWFDQFRRANPYLIAHWVLCYGNGRTSGAV